MQDSVYLPHPSTTLPLDLYICTSAGYNDRLLAPPVISHAGTGEQQFSKFAHKMLPNAEKAKNWVIRVVAADDSGGESAQLLALFLCLTTSRV